MDKVKNFQLSVEETIKSSALGQSSASHLFDTCRIFLFASVVSVTVLALAEYYKMAEETTKVPGVYLVLGAAAVFLLWLIFLPGAHLITSVLGFLYDPFRSYSNNGLPWCAARLEYLSPTQTSFGILVPTQTSALHAQFYTRYPAWSSFKAIETKGKEDDTQWLTYWMIFGWFSIMEFFIETITAWIPMYFVLKLGFLIWLASDATQGALTLYKLMLPQLKMIDAKLDALLGIAPAAKADIKESDSKAYSAASNVSKDLMS